MMRGGGCRNKAGKAGGGGGVGPHSVVEHHSPFCWVLSGSRHTGRVAETGIEALPPQITNITTHDAERNERKRGKDNVTLIESDESVRKKKSKEQKDEERMKFRVVCKRGQS